MADSFLSSSSCSSFSGGASAGYGLHRGCGQRYCLGQGPHHRCFGGNGCEAAATIEAQVTLLEEISRILQRDIEVHHLRLASVVGNFYEIHSVVLHSSQFTVQVLFKLENFDKIFSVEEA